MPSSYSTSLRFELQFTGENINTYGVKLDNTFARMDDAIAGLVTLALTTDHTLVSANDNTTSDEARTAILKFTGAGPFTVTIPSVSKKYDVWNACSAAVTITTGAGATAVIQPGEVVAILCDAANCKRVLGTDFGGVQITSVADPTSPQGVATKAYADALAFTANAGILPGQVGNSGKFLTTDGTTASWGTVAASVITGLSAAAAAVRTGTTTIAALTPGDTYNAFAVVTITYAASVAPNMGSFINSAITLTGNLTLANPTNHKVGQTGFIELIQDGTGSRLLSAVGSSWKRVGGLGVLSTTAGVTDILVFQVITSTLVLYDILRNPT